MVSSVRWFLIWVIHMQGRGLNAPGSSGAGCTIVATGFGALMTPQAFRMASAEVSGMCLLPPPHLQCNITSPIVCQHSRSPAAFVRTASHGFSQSWGLGAAICKPSKAHVVFTDPDYPKMGKAGHPLIGLSLSWPEQALCSEGQDVPRREGLGQRATMDGQLEFEGSQVAADGTCKLLFALRVCSSSAVTHWARISQAYVWTVSLSK